jgi:hypothetical protein
VPIGIGTGITLLSLGLLAMHMLPLGISSQWEWMPRIQDLRLGAWTLLALLVCLLTTAMIARTLRQPALPPRPACAGLVLLCVITSGGLLFAPVADDPLVAVNLGATTTSVAAMGYYGLAATVGSLRDGFGIYVTRDASLGLPGRIQTHPPGPFLWAYWGRRLTEAWPALGRGAMAFLNWRHGLTPEILHRFAAHYAVPGLAVAEAPGAWLNGLAATLAGALLPVAGFLLGTALWDRRAGLVAALLAGTLPSLLAFVPSIEGLAAVLAVLPVAALAAAMRRRSWPLGALAGLAFALALLWTPGVVVVLAPMVGMAMAVSLERRRLSGTTGPVAQPLWLLALAGATTAAAFLGLYLLTGYNFARDFRAMSEVHHGQIWRRSVGPWMPMNLWDFVLFMGPTLAALVAGSFLHVRRLPDAVRGAVLGMALGLVAVTLSGVTRGEVGRIWLFMMPLMAAGVSGWLPSLPGKESAKALGIVVACQVLLAMRLYMVLELVRP